MARTIRPTYGLSFYSMPHASFNPQSSSLCLLGLRELSNTSVSSNSIQWDRLYYRFVTWAGSLKGIVSRLLRPRISLFIFGLNSLLIVPDSFLSGRAPLCAPLSDQCRVIGTCFSALSARAMLFLPVLRALRGSIFFRAFVFS
jgi:hypothetical protein